MGEMREMRECGEIIKKLPTPPTNAQCPHRINLSTE
jgi:hypothetical protein